MLVRHASTCLISCHCSKDEAARLAALLAKCEGRNKQLEQELSRTAGQLQAAENTTNMIRMELGGMRAVRGVPP